MASLAILPLVNLLFSKMATKIVTPVITRFGHPDRREGHHTVQTPQLQTLQRPVYNVYGRCDGRACRDYNYTTTTTTTASATSTTFTTTTTSKLRTMRTLVISFVTTTEFTTPLWRPSSFLFATTAASSDVRNFL